MFTICIFYRNVYVCVGGRFGHIVIIMVIGRSLIEPSVKEDSKIK